MGRTSTNEHGNDIARISVSAAGIDVNDVSGMHTDMIVSIVNGEPAPTECELANVPGPA